MKEVMITPRVREDNRFCRKCKKPLEIGETVMVQRNQSGKHYCMDCWDKMCI